LKERPAGISIQPSTTTEKKKAEWNWLRILVYFRRFCSHIVDAYPGFAFQTALSFSARNVSPPVLPFAKLRFNQTRRFLELSWEPL
jgi:hypothetical protein